MHLHFLPCLYNFTTHISRHWKIPEYKIKLQQIQRMHILPLFIYKWYDRTMEVFDGTRKKNCTRDRYRSSFRHQKEKHIGFSSTFQEKIYPTVYVPITTYCHDEILYVVNGNRHMQTTRIRIIYTVYQMLWCKNLRLFVHRMHSNGVIPTMIVSNGITNHHYILAFNS